MSVNFLKIKNRSTARALMKHCDKIERLKNEHKNIDIDKKETERNLQLYEDKTLKQTMQRFTDRIETLDQTTNTNKRKDRVELFALDIPIPHGIQPEKFFKDMCERFQRAYGKTNVVNMYLHCDEKHEYLSSKDLTMRTSMNHIHAFVVPEIDGKLQGKLFSSKKRMKAINQFIDQVCRETYSIPFLTGTKEKSYDKVEDLKKASSEVTEELFSKLKEETPVNVSKTITGDIKLKKEDFDTIITKATAYDLSEERKKSLAIETSAAQQAQKAKNELSQEVTVLLKEKQQMMSQIEDLEEKQIALEAHKKVLNINPSTLSLLSEIADLAAENKKLKQQNSLLIKILKSIEKLIENTKIKQIIHKAIDTVEEKQYEQTQYHNTEL